MGVAPEESGAIRVGRYRIGELIGEGATGRVHLARDDAARATVAIKLVRPSLAGDPVFRRRFEREVRIARQIAHPNLVPVIDAGEHDGTLYLVAALMTGGSLADRIGRHGPLAIADALTIARDVAAGLGILAEHGLVHRDIKPPNVLFDALGTARITDFGLVADRHGTALTQVGRVLGSAHYMAPEQIRSETITGAADVYSLGCVLHECLSGHPPFAAERGMQVMWAQLTAEPPDPCAGRDDAPPGFGDAVRAALAKDPAQRPGDAVAYVRAVCDAAGIAPAPAAQPSAVSS